MIGKVWALYDSLIREVWSHEDRTEGWGIRSDGSSSPLDMPRVCLGVHEGRIPPGGFLALFLIMWKMIIIAFTRVDMEHALFNPEQVWEMALRRIVVRVRARAHTIKLKALRLEARGDPPPDEPRALNRRLMPLASVDEKGTLSWSPPLLKRLVNLKLISSGPEPRAQPSRPPPSGPVPGAARSLRNLISLATRDLAKRFSSKS